MLLDPASNTLWSRSTATASVASPRPPASITVRPSPALIPRHQALLASVQSAADFDSAYVGAQVMAHQESVALFSAYGSNGDVPPLAAFARQTLPNLQMHLQHAQALSGGGARAM